MANNKLLGCWGFVVGAMATAVVGWMTFALFIGILAGLGTDGLSAFADPVLLHEAGELLIVGLAILGIYVWVFRGLGLARFAAATRPVFWCGAALNVAAVFGMWGSRFSNWAAFLVVLTPFIFAWLADKVVVPPEQPFEIGSWKAFC
jgi:hypothetical protein